MRSVTYRNERSPQDADIGYGPPELLLGIG
jgi:hypothetical protein